MNQRYFNGVVPDPGERSEESTALLASVDKGFEEIGKLYNACKLRAALQLTLALATQVNQYLEETSPWKTAKTDIASTASSLYTAIQAINGLKIIFSPVLPFTSQELHALLGEEGRIFGSQQVITYQEPNSSHEALTYDGSGVTETWSRSVIPAGRQLPTPRPLFKKLDPALADEELERLYKRSRADRNQLDKNRADKNRADRNQLDKSRADKHRADKNRADKNQIDKSQG
jgi:methionyl-tRNA synthetase